MKNIPNQEEIKSAYAIYELMKKIRMTEEKIAEEYPKGEIRCPTHLSIGQEAPASLVSLATHKSDFAVSTHRSHAHYIGKGGSLEKMICELYGKENGCSKGKGGSMHLIDTEVGFMGSSAIVGNSIPIGTGISLSLKLRESNSVTVVYLGEAATEEGVFYESINFAALKKLKVLFVCENNKYSVYSPLSTRQPENRSIRDIVQGLGVENHAFYSGKDIMNTYKSIQKQVNDLRHQDNGPAFIEFETYRKREHCGPNYDNELGYRDNTEVIHWEERDAINNLSDKLSEWTKDFPAKEKEITDKLSKEIEDAFSAARSAAYPKQIDAFNDIYATAEASR